MVKTYHEIETEICIPVTLYYSVDEDENVELAPYLDSGNRKVTVDDVALEDLPVTERNSMKKIAEAHFKRGGKDV